MPTSNEKYTALLNDLRELEVYLHGRGDKTGELAQRFADNAKKDASNREFDLNQSRMLDYQKHVWHEIGNLVEKLVKQYE
ncbi:hypothetical protein [Tengunoibacter tsumagoiensis]|uniref:Uncharacterized protein n=1 Tax=Tengunoibacter tsumagoiensis TaxID=2014871 RepID=A0A401ZUT8_9CHLR|nr:hypothetical protein [Tengunoibacter tsumagoiensis]GCE10556.1 hypothetical protein KTT_04150 [Tengunoibacter tsumagoiensis]